MSRKVRLSGNVKGEIINIEVSEETFYKLTKYAMGNYSMEESRRRFNCTKDIFSDCAKRGWPIDEESVIKFLDEHKSAQAVTQRTMQEIH